MNKLSDNSTNNYTEIIINDNGLKISSQPIHNTNNIQIKIEGCLTINNVHKLKEIIEQKINLYDNLFFLLENILEIDLSHIQIFNLITLSNKYKNKTIVIESKLSPNDKNILNVCGYDFLF